MKNNFTNFLFSYPITGSFLKVNNKKILSVLKKTEFKENIIENSKSATQSNVSKTMCVLEYLPELKEQIKTSVLNHIKNTLYSNINFNFTNSWATLVRQNGFSQIHVHQNSWLSGVYYPEGNKGFSISFYNPVDEFWCLDGTINKYEEHNSHEWTFPVEENLLIIFPSKLRHRINTNTSNKIRYSIAFNTWPNGSIGLGDARVNIGNNNGALK